jgi:hypothetical protein
VTSPMTRWRVIASSIIPDRFYVGALPDCRCMS